MKQNSRVSLNRIKSPSSKITIQRVKALRRNISCCALALLLWCALAQPASALNMLSAQQNIRASNLPLIGDLDKIETTNKNLPLNNEQEERANFTFGFLIPKPLTYLLMPVPSAPTNLEVVSPTETSTPLSALIQLRWTASTGAVSYQIERSANLSQGFTPFATSTTTTFNDTPPSGAPPESVKTYLYRVRALDSSGASAPSNMAFATSISFTDPTITPHVTVIRGQRLRELRWSVNAVRKAAGLTENTWPTTGPEGEWIQATHINQLRDLLGEALAALSVPVAAYTDPTLYTGANGTFVKHEHFEELQERSTRGSSASSGPSGGGSSSSSTTARLDPMNQTGGGGENPLSGNFNWSLPLVGLKGRAGLDLGLSLSYNSLVWTKNGSSISFDDDRGFPAPGFRLGFPVIQSAFYKTEAGKYAFMLIAPDGGRTELRQVGASSLYEATDSSYLALDSSTMTLRTTDGTQLSYTWEGSDYECAEIKDSNGNYITINYSATTGQIDTIVDTLSRTVKFNYDATTGYLSSITQDWKVGDNTVSHPWARFDYGASDLSIQTNFSGLSVLGPQNNSTIKVLRKVTLDDDSHFDFDYTSWGQVWKVRSYAPNGDLLNYRAYNLPGSTLPDTSAQTDCPRFTERHDWAENWNRSGSSTGASGLPSGSEQEVVTYYDAPQARTWTLQPNGTSQTGLMSKVTMPDGSYQMIYYAGEAGTSTAWRRGLASVVETYDSSNNQQRQAVTLWTQDDEAAHFLLNPRVSETHIYDPAGNHKRTRVTYQSVNFTDGTTCNLPQDVYEYQPDATNIIRYTHTTYNLSTTYTNLRIIGLVSERTLYEGDPNSTHTLMSKVGFAYDEADSIQGANPSVQHDNPNYGTDSSIVRGNLTSVKRYNVDDTSQFTISSSKHNTAGAVVSTTDPLGHTVTISYADSFSDTNRNTLNTLAYPTMVTDAGGFKSYSKHNYDFGATTWTQTPKPNVTNDQLGPEQTFDYDAYGRIQKVTNLFNNAYTRYEYASSATKVDTYATVQDGAGEAHSFSIIDGAGRVIATASDHPNSTGGFSGQLVMYDVMGRVVKKSNPTETTAETTTTPINPTQWTVSGDDSPANGGAGWVYTQQAYDWKGRPTVTTNVDGTTKQISYGGCGCAGGEVETLTDEGVVINGTLTRRTQKVYHDVLGRTARTEAFNWDGTVYSSVVTIYNALDQVKYVREYASAAPAGADDPATSCPTGTCQQTAMTYDGYGRLKSKQLPSQTAATQYTYNDDDTANMVTDGRGVVTAFTYDATRGLLTKIHYTPPTGSGIASTPEVNIAYDAVGNRLSMTDGSGSVTYHYDQLSRLTSEERQFASPGPSGAFTLSYSYNLANQLTGITDPTGAVVSYGYDLTGRVTNVTGSSFGGVTSYISDLRYRASGALKGNASGDGTTTTISYNTRQEPTDYAVSGLISKRYEYHDDGRLGYSQDLINNKYDRSYEYDHAGRVIHAYSGPLARGQSDTDQRPYKLDYSYDAMNHLTGSSGRMWSAPYTADVGSGSYQHDRNTSWTYDVDGRLTDTGTDQYTFDAAGAATTVLNREQSVTQAQVFDGDGQRTSLISQQEIEHEDGTTSTETVTQYFVRSSVLGAVVTELDATGAKTRTFVYEGGQSIAWQQQAGSTQTLAWEHSDLSNASVRIPGSASGNATAELEPFGGNAGSVAQLSPPQPSHSALVAARTYPGFSDLLNSQYEVDGIDTPAEIAISLLDSRAADIDTNNSPGAANLPRLIPIYGRFCVDVSSKGYSTGVSCENSITGYASIGLFATNLTLGGQNVGPDVAPQNSHSSTAETEECKKHRANLIDNPQNLAALKNAWDRSQYRTSDTHEEHGLLGKLVGEHFWGKEGDPVDAPFDNPIRKTEYGRLVRYSQPGFLKWAMEKIADDDGSVSYSYWYHTHPYDAGPAYDIQHIWPGWRIDDPDQYSHGEPGSDGDISFNLRIKGVLVSPKHIVVFDVAGSPLCIFDRPF